MDNGQVQQNSRNGGSIFTTDPGTDVKKEDNLANQSENLNSNSSWGIQTERNVREIGSNVLNSSENEKNDNLSLAKEEVPDNQELGEVVDLSMPPGEEVSPEESMNSEPKEDTEEKDPIQYENIRTKERLNSEGVKAVNVIEHGLRKKPAKFYSTLQKARKANVDNFNERAA